MDEPGPKAKGIFWCEPCAQKHEPELFQNQKEDEGELLTTLKKWAYKQNKQKQFEAQAKHRLLKSLKDK